MEDLQHSQLNIDLSLVLSSCEPELQELMRQIDLIIKQQKRDWETEMQLVRNRLKRSEDELMVSRRLIEQKDLEVRSLCQRLKKQQELADKYAQQVQNIRAQFEQLKRGYHKLKHRQLKESQPGPSTEHLDLTGRIIKPEDVSWDHNSQQVQPSSTQLGQDSSTGTRHVQEWDRSPIISGSEGAIQRLLRQFQLMSSISEENSFHLAQDNAGLSSLHSSSSTSGSRLTIRNSAADSTANGQTCTSEESVLLTLQVKETRPASSVERCSSSQADHSKTLCCFLEKENQRSTELLQRLDIHIHQMKENNWKTQSKQPSKPLGPARTSEHFLARTGDPETQGCG